MTPSQLSDPQLGPALALVALRTEFPHLPPAKAAIDLDGHLRLTVHYPIAFEAFLAVLGGTPMARVSYVVDDMARESDNLFTTWRDVEVSLWGNYTVGPVQRLTVAAA